jgi:hypothetical protein
MSKDYGHSRKDWHSDYLLCMSMIMYCRPLLYLVISCWRNLHVRYLLLWYCTISIYWLVTLRYRILYWISREYFFPCFPFCTFFCDFRWFYVIFVLYLRGDTTWHNDLCIYRMYIGEGEGAGMYLLAASRCRRKEGGGGRVGSAL